jgi:hypothetical protein
MSRHLTSLIELIRSIPIDCWASGPTAAALHGVDGFVLKPPFHLTIERGHHLQRVGHHIHTARSLDRIDRSRVNGLPVLSATRTLVHLAETESIERLLGALESALRDGLTSEDFLHRRLVELRQRGRAGIRPVMQALERHEIGRGGESWLEQEFLRLSHAAGLPRPSPQQVLSRRRDSLIRVDCRYPGTNLVVELLGYRWHRTPLQMQVDAERLNRLQMDGFLVLQFTYRHVTLEPAWVVAHTIEGLSLARAA